MCNLINTHTHTYTHTQHGEEDTSMLGQAEARRLGARYAGRADIIPLRRRTRRMCAPHADQFDGGQHKYNHLARNNPRKEASPIRRPKIKYSSPPHCAHVKRPTRVQLPVLQPTNARFTPGRRTAFLKNSGDRYKRHAARIDMVSVTNAVTLTRTSADTRVGAIEHSQIPYPRILMDWTASLPQETQTRPRPLQRKLPTKVNSLHRAYFCRGE